MTPNHPLGHFSVGIRMQGLKLRDLHYEQSPMFKEELLAYLKECFDLRAAYEEPSMLAESGLDERMFTSDQKERERAQLVSRFVNAAARDGRSYHVSEAAVDAGCSPRDACWWDGTCDWDTMRAYEVRVVEQGGDLPLTADVACDRFNARVQQTSEAPQIASDSSLRNLSIVVYHRRPLGGVGPAGGGDA